MWSGFDKEKQGVISIKRNRQVRKNIKNNISFYKSSAGEAGEFAQGVIYRLFMVILGISVTVLSAFGAVNILFRIPDFFRYEFDRTEIIGKLGLNISSTDFGSFFSGYMLHSNDNFSYTAEFEGSERELFSRAEEAMMGNFRAVLDALLIIAVISLLVTVFLIAIMQYNRMARSLRGALNIGLGTYLAAAVGLTVYLNVYKGDMVLRNSMMSDGKLPADNLLIQMFDDRFITDATVAAVVISLIIMMIARYIVWKMTAQKGIFSEGLKGVAK